MANDLDILEGVWIVKVQGWVRAYTFVPKGQLNQGSSADVGFAN